MKNFHHIILPALALLSSLAFSQERPFRAGIETGRTNIGFDGEYVPPIGGGYISGTIDYMYLPLTRKIDTMDTDANVTLRLSGIGVGGNIYLFTPEKGLYAGVSYNFIGIKLSLSDVTSNENPGLTGGEGEMKVNMSTFTFKLGGKFGDTFYLRPEVGYTLTQEAPKEVELSVTYPEGQQATRTEANHTDFINILEFPVYASIGIGISF